MELLPLMRKYTYASVFVMMVLVLGALTAISEVAGWHTVSGVIVAQIIVGTFVLLFIKVFYQLIENSAKI